MATILQDTETPQQNDTQQPDPLGVAVCDGNGLHIKVVRGQLEITDRANSQVRVRRYSRASRGLRRIVVIGESGNITLSAMQWCSYLGVPIIVIHPDGRILSTSSYAQSGLAANDGRLRRAQASAIDTPVGMAVCHALLAEKLEGSADVVERFCPDGGEIARNLRRVGRIDIKTAKTVERCREIEGEAAAVYFSTWAGREITFCKADRPRVPQHWHSFASRNSRATKRRTAKNATDPINAILNYLYTVAATECRLACYALGLDPTMGYLHNDSPNRDSLVYDLLETVRPVVEEWTLALLTSHVFTCHDFLETPLGTCRIQAPLTHTLAATGPLWAQAVAPHAEHITHIIAKSSSHPIRCTTPLTASKMRTAQGKREYRAVDARLFRQTLPGSRCTDCGEEGCNCR